jgi:hypothetical protein
MIRTACEFLVSQNQVYIASTDARGYPHLAVAQGPTLSPNGYLVFEEWFCPATILNLRTNPKVVVAAIDRKTSMGYHARGAVVQTEENAMLNGLVGSREEELRGLPQIRWRLIIEIDEVMDFSDAFHNDLPLENPSDI